MTQQLTVVEQSALADCEQVIERGLATFVEVGDALRRVRDDKLYRQTHNTFEEYCRQRWGFVASRARQLMAAAEVAATVTDVTLAQPATEAVARELAPLRAEPEQLREAWTTAVEQHGPSPTAAQVREVVRPDVAPTVEDPEPESLRIAEDVLAEERADPARRRTRALKLLAEGVSATSTLARDVRQGLSLDDVAEAAAHDNPERHAADARRTAEVWSRLYERLTNPAAELRRVK